ncbi:lycopene cyclase domain-containing protein [Naasia sp. SYSU D00057]|uniref:lycopene cyclase domain-containing protein n=1 Tax=Naasia sp. SYSU D00057 TaxID=2817380 RepID=UPI001B304E9B|nr:lycopene cyclase domain-containing protein [Naasia sp. SYSU D00057]
MTYLALNAAFLVAPVLLFVFALLKLRRSRRPAPLLTAAGIALAVVLLLTAVFDNVLVGLGIVGYDESRISGIRIGVAPIEDFAYAVAAVLGLPSLWILLRRESR